MELQAFYVDYKLQNPTFHSRPLDICIYPKKLLLRPMHNLREATSCISWQYFQVRPENHYLLFICL